MAKDLKPKTVKNRVRLLRALPYKDHMVYIRMIGTDLFEWLLVHNKEIYNGSMIFTPTKGKTQLEDIEIERAAGLLWAGAVTTINTLIGETVTGEKKEIAERFLKANKVVN